MRMCDHCLAPRHHHSTPLLEKLHWLPISERIKYKGACMCFSAISGSGPAYLSELLHVYTPSRTLRSSSDTRMPEIQQYKRKTHGFRAFSCFGPHIWNSLSQDLRHCSSLSSFKAKLKTTYSTDHSRCIPVSITCTEKGLNLFLSVMHTCPLLIKNNNKKPNEP